MHKHYHLEARRWHEVDGKLVRRFLAPSGGESIVQKHQAHDTDINVIVKKFGVTGMLPQRLNALDVGSFDDIFDYQSAMNAIVAADRAFMTIDPDIRARFHNDPQRFHDFVLDPGNEEELRKLGLWNAVKEKAPELPPMKVEVVNPSIPPVIGGVKA